MSTFGDRLKREREKRNVSLEEIAKSTKISKRHLLELEEERFSDLPGGIFNKGFVRAYAKFLGLNEEELVGEYVAAEAASKADFVPPIAMETSKLMSSMAVAKEREESVRPSDPAAKVLSLAVGLVVVLGIAGYGYKYFEQERATSTASAAGPTSVTPAESASTPSNASAPLTSSAPGAQTPATTNAPVVTPIATASSGDLTPQRGVFVELKAKAESWLQVTADGRAPVEMTLAPNQSKKFFAAEKLVMKVGNAEGVEITRNGRVMPSPAPGTKTQTYTFTPEQL